MPKPLIGERLEYSIAAAWEFGFERTDTVMDCAVHSTLQAGQTFVTIEMRPVFVKAALDKTGKLTCEGNLLHSGRRMAGLERKIFDRRGNPIAHGSKNLK